MSGVEAGGRAAVNPTPGVLVSARVVVACAALLIVAALGAHFLDANRAAVAAFKVVSAMLVIAVVPGVLLTLVWRPRPQLSALEVLGFGIAISFGLIQLFTIVAVSLHASPAIMLAALGVVCVLMAALALSRQSLDVLLTADEVIVLVLIAGLGIPLYLQGSPIEMYEDQVLVAVMRRLSVLDAPATDNLYVAPGALYPYPFPGALYLMALVSRLGDIDPMFLYHKLRFFWGPAAIVMLYLAARAVFWRPSVACAVAVTAVVFITSGTFAMVAGFPAWWAQLVPFSYVPDVAMTVLLPALLVVSFGYLQSTGARDRAYFFVATAMLVLMLTMIHIREVIQFEAYMGCFVVVTGAVRGLRPYFARACAVLALTLVIAVIYTRWQAVAVPLVTEIVTGSQGDLLSTAAALPVRTLLFGSVSDTLPDFIQDFDQIFGGLMPAFLFIGPAAVLTFRRQPLVWLISSSMFAYLMVISVPLVAVPYVYLTYFEILHIPIRNVIFFVYLLSGAMLYVALVTLVRADRTRLLPLAGGVVGGALALLTTLCINRSHCGFFVPLIAAYGLTFLFVSAAPLRRGLTARGVTVAFVVLMTLFALWPDHAPTPRTAAVNVRWTAGLSDVRREALERQFGLTEGERTSSYSESVNVWGYRLNDLSTENVKALVTNPDVVDTNDIDRTTFTVPVQAPRGDYQFLGVEYATWLQYPGMPLLLLTSLLAWAVAIVVPAGLATAGGRQAVGSLEPALSAPFYRLAVPYALFIIPFALWSMRPSLSPLSVPPQPPAGHAATPGEMFAQIPCVELPSAPARFAEEVVLPERTTCPPSPAVIEWVQSNLPAEAVLAVERWTPYPPQVFLPQQAVIFPTLEASFIREDSLFRDYYRVFKERVQRYRTEPFFNVVESPAERADYVRTLGVTHVLLSPSHYDELRPVLDRLPDQFALRYNHDRWAVYEALTGRN